MRFVSPSIIAFITLASTASMSFAEEAKIATVDMQKALQSVEAGKNAKAQLEKEFNAKKKELQTEEAALKKLTEEFKKQAMVLNDEARAKKQQDIQERIMKFQETTARSQQAIQQKEQDLTAPILTKLRSLISETAKSKGYTLVLEKNENTVLYSQEQDDLTADVISAYNKKK
jgi:outer membrane protein